MNIKYNSFLPHFVPVWTVVNSLLLLKDAIQTQTHTHYAAGI